MKIYSYNELVQNLNQGVLKNGDFVSIEYQEIKQYLLDTDKYDNYRIFAEYDILIKYNDKYDILLHYCSDNIKYYDKDTHEDKTYLYKSLFDDIFNTFFTNVKTRQEITNFIMDKANLYRKDTPIYIIECLETNCEEGEE